MDEDDISEALSEAVGHHLTEHGNLSEHLPEAQLNKQRHVSSPVKRGPPFSAEMSNAGPPESERYGRAMYLERDGRYPRTNPLPMYPEPNRELYFHCRPAFHERHFHPLPRDREVGRDVRRVLQSSPRASPVHHSAHYGNPSSGRQVERYNITAHEPQSRLDIAPPSYDQSMPMLRNRLPPDEAEYAPNLPVHDRSAFMDRPERIERYSAIDVFHKMPPDIRNTSRGFDDRYLGDLAVPPRPREVLYRSLSPHDLRSHHSHYLPSSPPRRDAPPLVMQTITPRLSQRQRRPRSNRNSRAEVRKEDMPFDVMLQQHKRLQQDISPECVTRTSRIGEKSPETTNRYLAPHQTKMELSAQSGNDREARMQMFGHEILFKDIRQALSAVTESARSTPEKASRRHTASESNIQQQPRTMSPDQRPAALVSDQHVRVTTASHQPASLTGGRILSPPYRSKAVYTANYDEVQRRESSVPPDAYFGMPVVNERQFSETMSLSLLQAAVATDVNMEKNVSEREARQLAHADHDDRNPTEKGCADLAACSEPEVTENAPDMERNEQQNRLEVGNNDDLPDSEDEELLNLRLDALSSAYRRNIDIVNDESAAREESFPGTSQKKEKLRKKKTKQTKVKKKKIREPSKHFQLNVKSNLKDKTSRSSRRVDTRSDRRSHLKANISLSSKSSSFRRDRETSVSGSRNPITRTLGEELMKRKTNHGKEVLRDTRNTTEEGEQTMKLLQSTIASIRSNTNTSLVNDIAAPQLQTKVNYDEVEMDVASSDSEGGPGPQLIIDEKAVPSHANHYDLQDTEALESAEQPLPPGTEVKEELSTSQESIWELLDQPLEHHESVAESANQPDEIASSSVAVMPATEMALDLAEELSEDGEFQHAFDSPRLPNMLESTLSDAYQSADQDGAAFAGNLSPTAIPSRTVSEEPNTVLSKSSPEEESFDAKVERLSMDDTEEMRRQLLEQLSIIRMKAKAEDQPNRAEVDCSSRSPVITATESAVTIESVTSPTITTTSVVSAVSTEIIHSASESQRKPAGQSSPSPIESFSAEECEVSQPPAANTSSELHATVARTAAGNSASDTTVVSSSSRKVQADSAETTDSQKVKSSNVKLVSLSDEVEFHDNKSKVDKSSDNLAALDTARQVGGDSTRGSVAVSLSSTGDGQPKTADLDSVDMLSAKIHSREIEQNPNVRIDSPSRLATVSHCSHSEAGRFENVNRNDFEENGKGPAVVQPEPPQKMKSVVGEQSKLFGEISIECQRSESASGSADGPSSRYQPMVKSTIHQRAIQTKNEQLKQKHALRIKQAVRQGFARSKEERLRSTIDATVRPRRSTVSKNQKRKPVQTIVSPKKKLRQVSTAHRDIGVAVAETTEGSSDEDHDQQTKKKRRALAADDKVAASEKTPVAARAKSDSQSITSEPRTAANTSPAPPFATSGVATQNEGTSFRVSSPTSSAGVDSPLSGARKSVLLRLGPPVTNELPAVDVATDPSNRPRETSRKRKQSSSKIKLQKMAAADASKIAVSVQQERKNGTKQTRETDAVEIPSHGSQPVKRRKSSSKTAQSQEAQSGVTGLKSTVSHVENAGDVEVVKISTDEVMEQVSVPPAPSAIEEDKASMKIFEESASSSVGSAITAAPRSNAASSLASSSGGTHALAATIAEHAPKASTSAGKRSGQQLVSQKQFLPRNVQRRENEAELREVEKKLVRVRELLRVDKVELDHLRNEREVKNKEKKELQAEVVRFKKRLLQMEMKIERNAHAVGIIDQKLEKIETKTNQRQRLKIRFLKQLQQGKAVTAPLTAKPNVTAQKIKQTPAMDEEASALYKSMLQGSTESDVTAPRNEPLKANSERDLLPPDLDTVPERDPNNILKPGCNNAPKPDPKSFPQPGPSGGSSPKPSSAPEPNTARPSPKKVITSDPKSSLQPDPSIGPTPNNSSVPKSNPNKPGPSKISKPVPTNLSKVEPKGFVHNAPRPQFVHEPSPISIITPKPNIDSNSRPVSKVVSKAAALLPILESKAHKPASPKRGEADLNQIKLQREKLEEKAKLYQRAQELLEEKQRKRSQQKVSLTDSVPDPKKQNVASEMTPKAPPPPPSSSSETDTPKAETDLEVDVRADQTQLANIESYSKLVEAIRQKMSSERNSEQGDESNSTAPENGGVASLRKKDEQSPLTKAGSGPSVTSSANDERNESDGNDSDRDRDIPPLTPTLKHPRRASSERRNSMSEKHSDMRPFEPNSETIAKLSAYLTSQFSFASVNPDLSDGSEEEPLQRMFPVPECLSRWRVSAAEVARQTVSTAGDAEKDVIYRLQERQLANRRSLLRRFKSSRLSPSYRIQEKLSITSSTFSNKINPNKIFCKYGLTGQCLDEKCQAQHISDVTLQPNELYLDLLSYCPALLKKENGEPVKASDPIEVQLKAAEHSVERLCGPGKAHAGVTVDETCILLVDIINKELGVKLPHTTQLTRRDVKPRQTSKPEMEQDPEKVEEWSDDFDDEHQLRRLVEDIAPENEDRYFDADDHATVIDRLCTLLEKRPNDVNIRIQLAYCYLQNSEERAKNLDFALHILCLGIERDEQSEPLWSTYLPLFRHHHRGDIADKAEVEDIVEQAVLLLPYSKNVWREALRWNWSYEKLDSLYEQLVHNLLHREKASEEEGNVSIEEDFDYYSSWLLNAILERCHIALMCVGKSDASDALVVTLKELDAIRKEYFRSSNSEDPTSSSPPPARLPMTQRDMCHLHICYIHLYEFGSLPGCLYDQSLSNLDHGLNGATKNIDLVFSPSRPLNAQPDELRQLIKNALLACDDQLASITTNMINCLPLYRGLVSLEASLERWDVVTTACEHIIGVLKGDSSQSIPDDHSEEVAEVRSLWVETIMRCGNPVRITPAFDQAVTECPRSARLTYTAAVYQLNSDSADVEAALMYIDTCLCSFINVEECQSAIELHSRCKSLLRHEVGLLDGKLNLKAGVTKEDCEREKPYLWLIYCLLADVIHKDAESPNEVLGGKNCRDYFEAALSNVNGVEARELIWLQYLLHVRSTASYLAKNKDDTSRSSINLQQQKMKWLKQMTHLVKRCLLTVPCKYEIDPFPARAATEFYTDYSFHNKVVDIYLSCFPVRQRTFAMAAMTDAMPSNMPLLLRASRDYFRHGDNVSLISLLWKVTSQSRSRACCHDVRIWKMVLAANLAEGKFKQAHRLGQRALSILPYSSSLWSDMVAMVMVHGERVDVARIGARYRKLFDADIRSFIDGLVQST